MDNLSEATREIMWNISHGWLMYVFFAVGLGIFARGLAGRIRIWKNGKADNERLSDLGRRFTFMLKEIIFQRRVMDNAYPGFFHSFIFYSFAILVVTTLVVMFDYDFHTHLFRGGFYLLLSFAADAAGLLVLVGAAMAAWRRYVLKTKTLSTVAEDTWVLLLLAVIVAGGFLLEGLRIAVAGDPWAVFTPIGYVFSLPFEGIADETGRTLHLWLWWSHMILSMAWIAIIPYTKFFHILTIPANVFYSKFKSRGEFARKDIEAMISAEDFDEDNFSLGIESTDSLTWKQRLDLDACINCGRCEEVCPPYIAEVKFSPKDFIQNCRELLYKREKAKAAASGGESAGAADGAAAADAGGQASGAAGAPSAAAPTEGKIVGEAFDENFIWQCRMCMACEEACPAFIDHVDTMVEVRRNEVVMQGRLPAEAAAAMKMLENQGNPFGPQDDRVSWIASLGVPVAGPGDEYDILYWIGCITTFDTTKQKIATDLMKLLKKFGKSFAVLGADEKCCGDPARVIGQEYLFQAIAKEQVEILNRRKFKTILVSCPHCYNVLKNEYRQFGGNYDVIHHSEFLRDMLDSGELRPERPRTESIIFHDPCYLGRGQNIYKAPRGVLKAIPGADLREMKRHGRKSMCCGGGGGHFWMDFEEGKRINNIRIEQALETGARTIATGCGYCMQMLEDSIKIMNKDDDLQVVDIATLLMETLEEKEGTPGGPSA